MAQEAHDESANPARVVDGHMEAMTQNTIQNNNNEASIQPFDDNAFSDLNSTTSQRTRALHGPSYPDNEFTKPGVPDIIFSNVEESNQHIDTQPNLHDASRQGGDLASLAQHSGLKSSVSAASDLSKLTFFSIELVCDRGNAVHMSWEQSQLGEHHLHSPSGHSASKGSSQGASGVGLNRLHENQVESPAPSTHSNGVAMEPADGVENVDSIRNEICSSLAKSAFDGRRYLPLDQLCKILSPSVVRQLLLQHYEESKVSEYEIEVLGSQDGDTPVPPRRRRIFAILVMAKQVNRLAKFIEDNVDDTALPLHFDQVEKPKRESQVSYTLHRQDEVCQQGGHDRHNENQQDQHMTKEFDMWPCDVAQDFMLWQPIIHVPFFKFPGDKIYFYDLRQDSVLPFGEYDQQETGGYGSVRKATIHYSHHNRGRDSEDEQSDCFAIKKPHIPCLNDYLQEIEPFDKLGIDDNGPDLNHLIPLQLTFKHGRDYYLVFPWADGNLKKFWRQRSANPKDPDEVRWFMAQCSGIARGLRKLHHLSTQLSSQKAANANSVNAINGTEMILGGKEWGRHGDIKPENILWFENYKGERDFLVISDFGLTQFNSAHSRSKVQQDQILGYSGTYRPPDLHLENQPISQNYDVWSLGCVFLEFLSWFLLGYREAVDVFAQERLKDGPKGEVREDTFFTFEKGDKEPHDMSKRAMLKKSVVQWIEKLHKIPECTEPFHSLLDLIQFTMLVPNSDDRSKCRPVDTRLRRLASRCKKDDFAMKPSSRGPDPTRYPKPPEKNQKADLSPESSSKELTGMDPCQEDAEKAVPQSPGSSSTRRKLTAQKLASEGSREPTQREFDNETQVSDPFCGPDEAFEPQASRISPSASTRTVRKSQRADIALSNPGPTQESTEPQVTSSGAQFDDIPRILDHDDAARDSSDDLTSGHASIEEIAGNAETSSRNVIGEDKLGHFSESNTPNEATTDTNGELPKPQPSNNEPSSHTSRLGHDSETPILAEPLGSGRRSAVDTAQPTTRHPSRWQKFKQRHSNWWRIIFCCHRAAS